MTTTDLEPRQPGKTLDRLGLNPIELAERLAEVPEFVPKGMAKRPGAVLAAILTGDELGIGPMTSLAKIDVIEGRASLAAELMRAIVLARGHDLWQAEASVTKVTLGGRRLLPNGSYGEATFVTWTMDDARKAGLEGKKNWRTYPRAMLTARATGELCRLIFADELAGIRYTSEEVADGFVLDEDDEPAPSGTDDLGEAPEGAPSPPERKATRKAEDAGRSAIETTAKPAEPAQKRTRSKAPPAPPPPPPALPGEEEPQGEPEGAGEAPDVAPEGPERTYSPAQALAMAANDAGLDDVHRHGLYTALTAGRANSGSDLDREELDAAFALVERIKAGELEVVEVDPGAFEVRATADAELVELFGVDVARAEAPQTAGPEALGDVEAWRAYLRRKGLKVADVLRAAASLAADSGAKPRNLGELVASPELAAQVLAWADREGSK